MGRTLMLSTVALVTLLATPAKADILVWNLVADCPADKTEVKLTMTSGVEEYNSLDRAAETTTVYACGGACADPEPLATPISWSYVSTDCTCFPSGKDADATGGCDVDDFYTKCVEIHEAVLPYSCGELGYAKICVSESCEDEGIGGMAVEGAPCAELTPPAGADQCLASVEPDPDNNSSNNNSNNTGGNGNTSGTTGTTPPKDTLGEEGGCSLSGETAANLSLLSLLLLVAGLALLRSRARSR